MKFFIKRSSDSCAAGPDAESPWRDAERVVLSEQERWNFGDPSELSAENLDYWVKFGSNHRVEDGQITRDMQHVRWVIDIESIDDLLRLSRDAGPLVVASGSLCAPFDLEGQILPSIEIYDDWRE